MTETIDYDAIRALQAKCYEASSAKGFHEEGDAIRALAKAEGNPSYIADRLRNYQANKLMLMVGEVSEAHEELRKGRGVNETYYPTKVPGLTGKIPVELAHYQNRPHKPEGIPSELADVVIRVLDFAGAEGIDLASMIEEKLAYNATRPFKHGKKF